MHSYSEPRLIFLLSIETGSAIVRVLIRIISMIVIKVIVNNVTAV